MKKSLRNLSSPAFAESTSSGTVSSVANSAVSKSVGDKIRYARIEAGLSQKDLAAKLKLSDKAVSTYEVGRAQPSVEVLHEIGAATDRPVTYFIEDDVERDQEIDFLYKIKKIEQELAEIKEALRKKGYRF